jgi:hypothetical protein
MELEKSCAILIQQSFIDTSLKVMSNKFPDIAKKYSLEEFGNQSIWKCGNNDTRASAIDIIDTACKYGTCYNIITESFEPAGESVVNSVATDTEILNAAVDILTLIASSNQLLSINRQFDKKSARENALNMRREECKAIASGIIDATNEVGAINIGMQYSAFELPEGGIAALNTDEPITLGDSTELQ